MLQNYQDKAGEWRWRIVAHNGEIIAASSEGYKEWRDYKENLRLIKKVFESVDIDKL